MTSPFPGMDPFLERAGFWQDFHGSFGMGAKTVLNPNLPEHYSASVESDLYLHELSAKKRRFFARADSSVHVERDSSGGPDDVGTGGTAVAAASSILRRRLLPAVIPERHRRVEIRDTSGEEVVTVIELLSPTDKIRHRQTYLQKRADLLDSPVHLVEIDLLRAGRRMPMDDPPECDYLIVSSVAEQRPEIDVLPLSVRDRLPVLDVPLRDGEVVPFDLRAVLDLVYEASRYERRIYNYPPDPPLSDEDGVWAAGVLRDAGFIRPAATRGD